MTDRLSPPTLTRLRARGPAPVLLLCAALTLAGCGGDPPIVEEADIEATIRQVSVPAELAAGEAAFDANCSACHGSRALGTENGPPLINIIYEPSHHADIAFFFAVERGVRSHHWGFGDMPPLPNVSREQVEEIVAYVRYLQEQVGIS